MNAEAFIKEQIEACFEGEVSCQELDYEADLRELGLTSFHVIEIISALEEEYDFEIEEDDLDIEGLCCISDYLKVVEKYQETKIEQARKDAWNMVGGLFWKEGRVSARPSERDIACFLDGVGEGSDIGIIGASTKYLIEKAIGTGANVTVFDFSENMLSDLKEALGDACQYQLYDILSGGALDKKFDVLVSDRLVNRFTYQQAIKVIKNSIALLKSNGVAKHAIKLGYYKMDENLLAYGEQHGNTDTFYDKETKTFDYTKMQDFLEECIEDHGNISKDVLYKWYVGRGCESRFDMEDVEAMIQAAGGKLQKADLYDANKETKVFHIGLSD